MCLPSWADSQGCKWVKMGGRVRLTYFHRLKENYQKLRLALKFSFYTLLLIPLLSCFSPLSHSVFWSHLLLPAGLICQSCSWTLCSTISRNKKKRKKEKKPKVINVRRHGALMDRPINGRKNLAQGLMQMEARPVTSGANMRTRSMGRG